MLASSTAASLPPPLRRVPRGTSLGAPHGAAGGFDPLHPLPPRRRSLVCRADLQQDAPFAAAIGACVLASLAFPPRRPRGEAGDEDEEEGEFGATDTRLGVMGIISLLPYFNWLSWIFAWLDSGKRRYLVYAAVYLAPYLRTNLSLSPDESWLPVASIFICILHVQLEAAVRNGDIENFKLVESRARPLATARKYSRQAYLQKRRDKKIQDIRDEIFQDVKLTEAEEEFRYCKYALLIFELANMYHRCTQHLPLTAGASPRSPPPAPICSFFV